MPFHVNNGYAKAYVYACIACLVYFCSLLLLHTYVIYVKVITRRYKQVFSPPFPTNNVFRYCARLSGRCAAFGKIAYAYKFVWQSAYRRVTVHTSASLR